MISKRNKRKLIVTNAGRWYLGLTILLGVVAVSSGNNILYLLESFLLGGLLLSGVVSERTLKNLELQWRRAPCFAGEAARDRVIIHNTGRMPLFCLEIGEWREKKFHPIAFVPFLGPLKTVTVRTNQIYPKRGAHRWEGIACATKYPFGFAQKIRWWPQPGSRLIWPERITGSVSFGLSERGAKREGQEIQALRSSDHSSSVRGKIGSGSFAEGEIRPVEPSDDYRYVVWTLSALRTEPVVRVRRQEMADLEILLDLRIPEGFEDSVKRTAHRFYQMKEAAAGRLILISSKGRKRVEGNRHILDALAIVEPEGAASA